MIVLKQVNARLTVTCRGCTLSWITAYDALKNARSPIQVSIMPPDITRSYVRHSLQRVSKQPLHAKRGCGTKTQDSKEGMNIYTVMTVKNIDTGNSQNRNAKTGKHVYNTHIYTIAVA